MHNFAQIPIYSRPVGRVQRKLSINQPHDEFEQEADEVSERILRMPDPQLHRKCACGGTCPDCEKKTLEAEPARLQLKRYSSASGPDEAPIQVHEVLRAPGRPLDGATREFMESRFGHNFAAVRVHADEAAERSAKGINALAYTLGSNVVFGAGQYAPGTAGGRRLLAHELTHVIQQTGSDSAERPPTTAECGPASATAVAKPRAGFDFGSIPIYPNGTAAKGPPDRRIVQRQAAPTAPAAAMPPSPKPKITVFFAYHQSTGATGVLANGREVFVRLTENKLPAGSYRLERHNEIPGQYQYRVFRLDGDNRDRRGAELPPHADFQWDAMYLGADEIALTIASDGTAAFFKSVEDRSGITLTIPDRARIAAAIQKEGVTRDDWYEFRHPGGRRPKTSQEAAELVERWVAEREQDKEAAAKMEQTFLESSARTMTIGEGLDESMTEIYRDYRQLQKLSHLTPDNLKDFQKAYPEGWKRIQELGLGGDYRGELTARIERNLAPYGISGIPEFEARIDAFEKVFRATTVNLASQVLSDGYRVCDRFLVEAYNVQYSTGWNEKGKIVAAALAPERTSIEDRIDAAEKRGSDAVRKATSAPWNRVSADDTEAELNAAEAAKKSALDEVSFLLPQFPFVAWPDFPRERLLQKTDPADVMVLIGTYLAEHRLAIDNARVQLKSKPEQIYKLDILLNLAKQKFDFTEGSIFDLIVADKVEEASHESLLSKIETALLFALMIASVVVTGGASIAVSFAIAGLSAAQAYDLYTQYNADLAAHKANLSSVRPSEFWVIAAMIGAAMDSKAAIDALAESAALRKAVQDFTKTRQVDKLVQELDRLSHLPNPEISEKAAKAIEEKAAAEVGRTATPAADSAAETAGMHPDADREGVDVVAGEGEKASMLAAELEEGVLSEAPSAVPGHKIKITLHGKIVRCTTCAELADKYYFILKRDRDLARDLTALEDKARAAAATGDRAALSRIATATRRLEDRILDQAVIEAESLWEMQGRLVDRAGLRAEFAEHTEEFTRKMEDRAAILEQQSSATGVDRLGSAASHEEGMASSVYARLRDRTPTQEIRDMVNAGLHPPYPDPILRGLMVTGAVHADHIVPMLEIIKMRGPLGGFLDLAEEDMLAVLNYRSNFIGLSEAANTSKGTKLFYDWIRHAGADTLVDPAFRQAMALREIELEAELENEIQIRLRRARFNAGIR
jgi:hypothetical protein